jgi:predicted ABC-type ATPase
MQIALLPGCLPLILRVSPWQQGGHSNPSYVIERRYFAGIRNLVNLYLPICDNWMVINNLGSHPELVANGAIEGEKVINNSDIWDKILRQSKHA